MVPRARASSVRRLLFQWDVCAASWLEASSGENLSDVAGVEPFPAALDRALMA